MAGVHAMKLSTTKLAQTRCVPCLTRPCSVHLFIFVCCSVGDGERPACLRVLLRRGRWRDAHRKRLHTRSAFAPPFCSPPSPFLFSSPTLVGLDSRHPLLLAQPPCRRDATRQSRAANGARVQLDLALTTFDTTHPFPRQVFCVVDNFPHQHFCCLFFSCWYFMTTNSTYFCSRRKQAQ